MKPVKKQNPFKLREFRGVNPETVEKLEQHGIKTAPAMLLAGASIAHRISLAEELSISELSIEELVKLSDLARLPGVKGIRARLYYDAGLDSVEKLANANAEELLSYLIDFVKRTNFDGIPPLPKEISSTIENAKKLPIVVEGC